MPKNVIQHHEWNTRNPEPLREVILKGHLRQLKGKRPIPPPNCKSFYQELGVCTPDKLCGMIKNPSQYASRAVQIGSSRRRKPDGNAKVSPRAE